MSLKPRYPYEQKKLVQSGSEGEIARMPLRALVDAAAHILPSVVSEMAVPEDTRDTAARQRVARAVEEIAEPFADFAADTVDDVINRFSGQSRGAARRARIRQLREGK